MAQNQKMGSPEAGALIVVPNRGLRWWLAAVLIVLGGLAPLYRSLLEPSLGWRFVTGPGGTVVGEPVRPGLAPLAAVRAIEGGGERVDLGPLLTIESAGMHNSFDEENEFFDRHRELWNILRASAVRIHHAAGATDAIPQPRTIRELGLRFWLPWMVALLSLSVGLAMWIFQPRGSAAQCYLVASGGYGFGMLCTASWGSRLLSQPPFGWMELHVLSHLASFMLSGGLCALLWLHPRRLGGNWLPWGLVCVAAVSLAAEEWQWVPGITLAFRLPVVLMSALLVVFYVLQWRACRDDPGQRAQLKWFGLLMAVSLTSTFIAYAFGAAGHVVAIPQNYGLSVIALMFLGLVPLVTRVGLFQLEAWWPRAWLWFLGGLLVVVMDLLLAGAFRWSSDVAFAVSLALAGWLYFPLRQWLWRRLMRGSLPETRDVLPQVLQIVTQAQGDPVALNARWRQLWDTVFQPQRMQAAPSGSALRIAGEGRRLVVAAAAPLEALELGLPERGARLFNPADARRARELCELVRQGLASGEAFEQGARQERRRIASDLHDDLGAQLLTIAQASRQSQERDRIAAMARQALDEMRLSVRGLAGEPARAQDVLADWRAECVTRLAAAGMSAEWDAQEPPEALVLAARTHVQLTRILREAVSNTIRHSGARACAVRIAFPAGGLQLVVEDDGRGFAAGERGDGHGLANIERRARSVQGTHRFETPPAGGTRLVVTLPLARQSANIDAES
jgi:signal transduction histidine kinase